MVGYGSMNLELPLRTLGEQPIFLQTGGAFVSYVLADGSWVLCRLQLGHDQSMMLSVVSPWPLGTTQNIPGRHMLYPVSPQRKLLLLVHSVMCTYTHCSPSQLVCKLTRCFGMQPSVAMV